ncbi:hypothetical protein [Fuscovulum ytuae]|uniref:Uncharacterized protein n=1 Tax=Fuscovulum ytuae TaxID=3042299 RepID=A0ABY8Q9B2_9RHOB|nr:hypothetical protein [Fuscovulum sp. YMD61]WGV17257.1 hypothetical protein QF092_05475 [Fuscovulum sp. YMD61]
MLTKAEGAVHVSARWQRLNGYFSHALGETHPAILRHGLVRDTADWPFLRLNALPATQGRTAHPTLHRYRMGHPAHPAFGPR